MIGLVGTAAFVYLLAWALNRRLAWINRLLLPPSLLGGAVLLLLGPQVSGTFGKEIVPLEYYDSYRTWPGVLISFLFSGMILEPATRRGKAGLAVISQSLYVWLIAFVQLAWGYTVVLFFAVNPRERLFAHAIELSFLGGHGAASAFYAVAERLGNRAAADLSVAAATIGMLFGLGGGLLLAAFHRRHNKFGVGLFLEAHSSSDSDSGPDARKKTASQQVSIPVTEQAEEEQRLLLSFLLPVLPVFLAYVLVEVLSGMMSAVQELPLFFFVILIAHTLKKLFQPLLSVTAVRTFHRLALEGLILSAVATLSLQTIENHAGLLFALCAGAAVITVLLHLLAAPRLTPEYPDLALINFGMSTGTTAVGLALLRSLRQSLPVRSVQIYGLAAPFSGPFIGGGILSLLVFPELTMQLSPPVMLIATVALSVITVGLSLLLKRLQTG